MLELVNNLFISFSINARDNSPNSLLLETIVVRGVEFLLMRRDSKSAFIRRKVLISCSNF